MIQHIGFTVKNIETTKEMYKQALSPLGLGVQMEGHGYVGFGKDGNNELWLGVPNERHKDVAKDVHVCFGVSSKEMVDQFYSQGLAAGFTDNGAPGIREHYAPNYYAAFLIDADGNNIEAVHFI